MTKENLILVHSFPTNSILLSGLIEYLEDFFNVYFVDLPGFTKQVPPLPEITMEGYCRFFRERISELDLDSYLVGGISFGFTVVNSVEHEPNRCKGVLALAPFIGPDSLRMGFFKKLAYTFFIKSVCFLNLSYPLWRSNLLRTYLPKLRGYPAGAIDIMLEQVDGRTFFETANLLLSDETEHKFHPVPYVLVANKDDRSVNFDYLYRVLSENVDSLLVVNTVMDHYPEKTTKEYFREQMPEEKVRQILDFLSLR